MKSLKNRSHRIKHSSCITKINTAQFNTRSERFQQPVGSITSCTTKRLFNNFHLLLMGTQIFFFVPRPGQDEKHLFPFVYRAQKLTIFLILFKNIIDIAATGSMQECVSYMNLVMSLAHHRVSVAQWWSVGAQNPKVWVLIIFCYVPRSWQDEKHLSQILFISSQLSDLRKGAFTNWRTLMNPSLFFSLFLVI